MPNDEVKGGPNDTPLEDERAAFDNFEVADEDEQETATEDEQVDEADEAETTEEATEEDETEIKADTESDEERSDEEIEDEVYQSLKRLDKDIFKKIPELKRVIFREQAFTQVFPTVEHAKRAAQATQLLEGYIGDITTGNSANIIVALSRMESGNEKVEQFVAGLIPTVEKHSKDLYLQMIYPEIKRLCRVFSKSQDENLVNSALHIHNAVFGDTNLGADVGLKNETQKRDPKADELTQREMEFERRQYGSFYQDVSGLAANRLGRKIAAPFKDSGISDLQQKLLVKEIYDRVESQIVKDVRHMGNMNHLWEQARRSGYTSEWKDRITNAYLSRATLLIPKVRQQVLAESKMSVRTDEQGKKVVKRIPSSSSSSNIGGRGMKVDKSKVDWNATDDRAALDGKFVMKK